ncbi:hypothetical protein [Egicoccus halophilus]|uniref:Uncharacterized protein n=1 Tax=Egicoccus halophilus TaxID=1670830 RepID=A0A8J3AAN9_9ACTN|nr:hypothetical protein [Egicoccus halophilus]GGI06632.1 hypothetical protein GCM10011354_20060 [Egicoccus halophilus]
MSDLRVLTPVDDTPVPVGPTVLGMSMSAEARVVDGWLERELEVPAGLDGPAGILQGGFATGVAIAAARAVDRIDAPLTSLDARLFAPTPLDTTLTIRVRPTDVTARYEVETRHGEQTLVAATVELAGHDPAPRVYDLLELATVPIPPGRTDSPFPHCFVCGGDPRHEHALGILPAWAGEGRISQPWVAEEVLGDERGVVDPLLVSAVLDCPTVWSAWHEVEANGWEGALLGHYHVRFFGDAPVMEPLRTVARLDGVDGRKVRARGALVDEDGVVYATSSGLHIGVAQLPCGD